jgi:hypothetical protein
LNPPATILFVCYGSAHVRMVVPVARAVLEAGLAQVRVLGLTTAAPVVRAAGLPLLQIKDFVQATDAAALAIGRQLVAGMQAVEDPEESAAYLGLCYAELQAEVGAEEAARRYARDGRQAFLPRLLLERILRSVQPRLLVATNSPRAERAAVLAARALAIPAVCMVDLFALDEVRWIGQPGYADRICVLNEKVREFLVASGRKPQEIEVTGNPAFDALQSPELQAQGQALRQAQGWQGRRVLLWPTQVEPAFHPFDGRPGDPTLPSRVLQAVLRWVLAQQDVVLCVRPRPGEAPPALPADPRIVVTGQDWPLPVLLAAADAVVTLNSTVGLEGHLAGARVVQVLGSVFDEVMPLARFGLADAGVQLDALDAALQQWARAPRRPPAALSAATPRVLEVLREFL